MIVFGGLLCNKNYNTQRFYALRPICVRDRSEKPAVRWRSEAEPPKRGLVANSPTPTARISLRENSKEEGVRHNKNRNKKNGIFLTFLFKFGV